MEFSEKQLFEIFNKALNNSNNIFNENESQFVAYFNGKLFKTNKGKSVFDSEKNLIKAIKQSDMFYNIKFIIYNQIINDQKCNNHEWHSKNTKVKKEVKSIIDYLVEQLIVAKLLVIKDLSKDY